MRVLQPAAVMITGRMTLLARQAMDNFYAEQAEEGKSGMTLGQGSRTRHARRTYPRSGLRCVPAAVRGAGGALVEAEGDRDQLPGPPGIACWLFRSPVAVPWRAAGSPDRMGVQPGPLPAALREPWGLALGPTGDLAISDATENAIQVAASRP